MFKRLLTAAQVTKSEEPEQLRALVALLALWESEAPWASPDATPGSKALEPVEGGGGRAAVSALHASWRDLLGAMLACQLEEDALEVLDSAALAYSAPAASGGTKRWVLLNPTKSLLNPYLTPLNPY